jgi:hypothetical protein
MEEMKSQEIDPFSKRKMNDIFQRLQENEENSTNIGICIWMIII